MRTFYLTFRDNSKGYTVCNLLSWSHIRLIMRLDNKEAQDYYLHEEELACDLKKDYSILTIRKPKPLSRVSGMKFARQTTVKNLIH